MKITIEVDNELEHALELHLAHGVSMQTYTKAALRFFRDMYTQEVGGKTVGFGDKGRFTNYNTEASPKRYLSGGSTE